MQQYRQNLIHLITKTEADLKIDTLKIIDILNARELANMFVDVSFLITGIDFILGQYWLEDKSRDEDENSIALANFIKKFFKGELRPLLFFQASLEHASLDQIKIYQKHIFTIQQVIVSFVKTMQSPQNYDFAVTTLNIMSELFEFEHQLVMKKNQLNQHLGYTLYRTFDILDECFNLNYKSELSLNLHANSPERIYLNSGVAVQSSYAALLMALRYLKIPGGSRFIDLGSGFGRVGLVVGLLRPDIQFSGYEFVSHRVDIASAASQSLGISTKVKFFEQDLSAKDFFIPDAEIYYLYDPFTDDTYKHVLAQLNEIAARKKINVITKGNAKLHLLLDGQGKNWSQPQEFQTGNFCLFRSK